MFRIFSREVHIHTRAEPLGWQKKNKDTFFFANFDVGSIAKNDNFKAQLVGEAVELANQG